MDALSLIPNPWISNPAVPSDAGAVAGKAASAEPVEPPQAEAAAHLPSSAGALSCSLPGDGESDPVVTQDWAPAETNHIPELIALARRSYPRGFDPHALLDTLEELAAQIDDVPLIIIRERARRWAA